MRCYQPRSLAVLVAMVCSVGLYSSKVHADTYQPVTSNSTPSTQVVSQPTVVASARAVSTNPQAAMPGQTSIPTDTHATQMQFVKSKWNATLYGFVEADSIFDSTRSFADYAGNSKIALPTTLNGSNNRLTFGVRNSRIGFKISAPEYNSIKSTAVLEMDFLGNQPGTTSTPGGSAGTLSESSFFTSPTFRIRHAYVKMEDPVVDVLAGQYWELFGWQPYFHPSTVEIQGVVGQVYSRSPQIRLSHKFVGDSFSVSVAADASRPPNRDSYTPDGQAGILIATDTRKALHTMGSTGTASDGMALGVSGTVRRLTAIDDNTQTTNKSKIGDGISLDALIPIIPGTTTNWANALTLTGSYVRGTGISDLYTGLNGGFSFPANQLTKVGGNSVAYTADIDPGLVAFDSVGGLHTINLQSFIVGLQYYLPTKDRFWLASNYSQVDLGNAAALVGVGAATASSVYKREQRWDGNVFYDVTPAVRIGASYAWYRDTYVSNVSATDRRFQLSFFYLF